MVAVLCEARWSQLSGLPLSRSDATQVDAVEVVTQLWAGTGPKTIESRSFGGKISLFTPQRIF